MTKRKLKKTIATSLMVISAITNLNATKVMAYTLYTEDDGAYASIEGLKAAATAYVAYDGDKSQSNNQTLTGYGTASASISTSSFSHHTINGTGAIVGLNDAILFSQYHKMD